MYLCQTTARRLCIRSICSREMLIRSWRVARKGARVMQTRSSTVAMPAVMSRRQTLGRSSLTADSDTRICRRSGKISWKRCVAAHASNAVLTANASHSRMLSKTACTPSMICGAARGARGSQQAQKEDRGNHTSRSHHKRDAAVQDGVFGSSTPPIARSYDTEE
jgi:hypothetical protein